MNLNYRTFSLQNISMFQSLIEQPPITQEVLTKITGELITRYEIKQNCSPLEFAADLARLSQQMRLYGEVLEQLSSHSTALRAFHHQFFRLLDFLTKQVTRQRPMCTPTQIMPAAFCGGCSGLLEQRNIRQLHRELLNCAQVELERSERSSHAEELAQITPEELLVRRMGNLQQNITERQVNLIRCIDDFESMRNDMLLGLRRREFDREFDSFDMKAYALQLTTHFLSSLTRIEEKITRIKRSIHVVEDQAVQTVPNTDAPPPPTAKVDSKPQNGRSEAQYRKLNDLKLRLEESCRRYQLQLREALSKLEAVQAQNKGLREEMASEKFKKEVREKTARNADEKAKSEEQKAKRESLQMLLAGEQMLVGEFESRFLQNYVGSGSGSESQIMPIIKATFKRTFEGFFNHRLSLNLHSRPQLTPLPPTQQHDSVDRHSRSRRKSIRLLMEEGRELSRFGQRRVNNRNMLISSQVNYKLTIKAPLPLSHHKSSSSGSIYKKAVLYTEGSVKGKRTRYSKLNSILSQFKDNQKDNSDFLLAKKYSQTMQADHFEHLQLPQAKPKGKKMKLGRNHSQQLMEGVPSREQKENKMKGGLRLQGVRLSSIDSTAVKQFLFLNDVDLESIPLPPAPRPPHKGEYQQLSIESISVGQTVAKKQKIILNLQEINYLTNFYSLLAKIHMIDPATYNKLKTWILSKGREKAQNGKQSIILKQIVSEVVFKHRQCKLGNHSLCPHLKAFLHELQTTLKSIDSPS